MQSELGAVLMNRYAKKPPTEAPAQSPQAPARPDTKGMIQQMGQMGSKMADLRPIPEQQAGGQLDHIMKDGFSGAPSKGGFQLGTTPPTWSMPVMPRSPMDLPQGLPTEGPKVPPRVERFETGEMMKDAYRDGWSPNPILLRILRGN